MDSINLTAQFRDTTTELLNAEGIYPVLDYGWEDENTVSDEYVGLEMWTTSPPFSPDISAWDEEDVSVTIPSKAEKVFYSSGEDFIGTMEFARSAIGFMLYCLKHVDLDNLIDDDDLFWEHSATATLWLNIASDRIRDYFIMARFNMKSELYWKKRKLNDDEDYAGAFRRGDTIETPNARITLESLINVAENLCKYRKTRNAIVHETASRRGHNAVSWLRAQAPASRNNVARTAGSPTELKADWNTTQKQFSDSRYKELQNASLAVTTWYLDLVKASALVFEYEYWKRIAK